MIPMRSTLERCPDARARCRAHIQHGIILQFNRSGSVSTDNPHTDACHRFTHTVSETACEIQRVYPTTTRLKTPTTHMVNIYTSF